jgi:hypothetical protein
MADGSSLLESVNEELALRGMPRFAADGTMAIAFKHIEALARGPATSEAPSPTRCPACTATMSTYHYKGHEVGRVCAKCWPMPTGHAAGVPHAADDGPLPFDEEYAALTDGDGVAAVAEHRAKLLRRYRECARAIWATYTMDPIPLGEELDRLESLVSRGQIGPVRAPDAPPGSPVAPIVAPHYGFVERLRVLVDEAVGLQPADTTPEALFTLVERKLFEQRRDLGAARTLAEQATDAHARAERSCAQIQTEVEDYLSQVVDQVLSIVADPCSRPLGAPGSIVLRAQRTGVELAEAHRRAATQEGSITP